MVNNLKSDTRYQQRDTRYEFGQTRRYPKGKIENSKKIFRFSNSLFYNNLPFFLYAARCPLYAVFRPNAQLRPIVERRCFSVLACPELVEGCSFKTEYLNRTLLKNPRLLNHYISMYAYTNILSDAALSEVERTCLKSRMCRVHQAEQKQCQSVSKKSLCPVAIRSIKKTKIMQNKPNSQNAKNVLTLVDTRNYNKL